MRNGKTRGNLMTKLKLTEEQRKFLENNFNNFSEEQINSKVQFYMCGIPVGPLENLRDYCTMEGIDAQLAKADGMPAALIYFAHMYQPQKWEIAKMTVTKLEA
jgi:hypothetical protein